MPLPRWEVGIGTIDGANAVFTVSSAYLPGTIATFLNGQLKRSDFLDGWTESDPDGGEVTLSEPPKVGDVVQFFYLDTSPVLPGAEVHKISGKVATLISFKTVIDQNFMNGKIVGIATLKAKSSDLMSLAGKFATDVSISGKISCIS